MIRSTTLFAMLLLFLNSSAQIRIDSSFAFQTNPAKKYSIYVPSTYLATTPNGLMVGFHPLNTSRWDGESWCDTLIAFSEANNLILACPDGGTNGDMTDPIDYDFTTALIDSMQLWYNIDASRIYGMGFSMGGVATYEYGFNHISDFGGFIPIGAAISSTFPSIIGNSEGKPYYVIHGGNDSPSSRFYPMLNGLENSCAIVNSLLMPGVGHTVDFPNRNQIITDAFKWVDSVNLAPEVLIGFPFSSIAPANGANITVKGFTNQALEFKWESSDFNASCVSYELVMDLLGGNFSAPVYSITSGNAGTDTSIQISYHILDSLLNDNGIPVGSYLNLEWVVAAKYHGRFVDTSKTSLLGLKKAGIGFRLISPANNAAPVLTNNFTLQFNWSDVDATGVTYELLFDTVGGNFSNPVKVYPGENSGVTSQVTQTHEEWYYDLVFNQNIPVGDSVHYDWTARATDGSFNELASSIRKVSLERGNVGFQLVSPPENSLLLGRAGASVLFLWDSVPLPGITYEWIMDTSGGDFSNPLTTFEANNAGMNRKFNASFQVLDSILNVYNIAYGDTLFGSWTVKAISSSDEFFAFKPFDANVFRDYPAGTIQWTSQGEVILFPNPASDFVSISTKAFGNGHFDLELYNTNGQLLHRFEEINAGNEPFRMPLEGLQKGAYLLKIKSKEGVINRTVLIQ